MLFVVKRYAVRKVKIRPYAERRLKIKKYAKVSGSHSEQNQATAESNKGPTRLRKYPNQSTKYMFSPSEI